MRPARWMPASQGVPLTPDTTGTWLPRAPGSPLVRGWVALAAIAFFFGRDWFEAVFRGDEFWGLTGGRAPWPCCSCVVVRPAAGGRVLPVLVVLPVTRWRTTTSGSTPASCSASSARPGWTGCRRSTSCSPCWHGSSAWPNSSSRWPTPASPPCGWRTCALDDGPAAPRHHPGPAPPGLTSEPGHAQEPVPEAPRTADAGRAGRRAVGAARCSRATRVFLAIVLHCGVVLSAFMSKTGIHGPPDPGRVRRWPPATGPRSTTATTSRAAVSPDGIRLRYGLLDTQAQTVPPGRIQALESQPAAAVAAFGWYRMQVNVAGYGLSAAPANVRSRTTLLAGGYPAEVMEMLSLVLPDPGTADPFTVFTAGLAGSPGTGPERRRVPSDGGFVTSPPGAFLAPLGWRRNGFAARDRAAGPQSAGCGAASSWCRTSAPSPWRCTRARSPGGSGWPTWSCTPPPGRSRRWSPDRRSDTARRLFDEQAARAAAARRRSLPERGSKPRAEPTPEERADRGGHRAPGGPARSAAADGPQPEGNPPWRAALSPAGLGIGVIGAGKVGAVLGAALRGAGTPSSAFPQSQRTARNGRRTCCPACRYWRSRRSWSGPNWSCWRYRMMRCRTWWTGLAAAGVWQPGQLVVHTSGRFGTGVLRAGTGRTEPSRWPSTPP